MIIIFGNWELIIQYAVKFHLFKRYFTWKIQNSYLGYIDVRYGLSSLWTKSLCSNLFRCMKSPEILCTVEEITSLIFKGKQRPLW